MAQNGMYPQRTEKKEERGIGRNEWRGGRASRNS
jgi:hypothetical protein